jgi:hypothetical protein
VKVVFIWEYADAVDIVILKKNVKIMKVKDLMIGGLRTWT